MPLVDHRQSFLHGKLHDAIPVFQRALALQRATLGPGHPNDAKLLTNLAGALMEGSTPDYRQAEAMQREAIAISERLAIRIDRIGWRVMAGFSGGVPRSAMHGSC